MADQDAEQRERDRRLESFAKAALTGILASNYEDLGYKEAAQQAFEYAEAMLAEWDSVSYLSTLSARARHRATRHEK